MSNIAESMMVHKREEYMKIKITVEVIECKNDNFKESQKLLQYATKGIVEKFTGRLRGLGQGIYGSFGVGSTSSTQIELEDEEEKKVEG